VLLNLIYCELLTFSELNPSLVGLALTYCIALANSSQYAIKQSTEVENMVSHIIINNGSYQCHVA
jgi:hypothetical protein